MPPRSKLHQSFGSRIRELRNRADLTQEELADKARLDTTYISGIERGTRNPSLMVLDRLAEAFGVSLAELLRGVSSKETK